MPSGRRHSGTPLVTVKGLVVWSPSEQVPHASDLRLGNLVQRAPRPVRQRPELTRKAGSGSNRDGEPLMNATVVNPAPDRRPASMLRKDRVDHHRS